MCDSRKDEDNDDNAGDADDTDGESDSVEEEAVWSMIVRCAIGTSGTAESRGRTGGGEESGLGGR